MRSARRDRRDSNALSFFIFQIRETITLSAAPAAPGARGDATTRTVQYISFDGQPTCSASACP